MYTQRHQPTIVCLHKLSAHFLSAKSVLFGLIHRLHLTLFVVILSDTSSWCCVNLLEILIDALWELAPVQTEKVPPSKGTYMIDNSGRESGSQGPRATTTKEGEAICPTTPMLFTAPIDWLEAIDPFSDRHIKPGRREEKGQYCARKAAVVHLQCHLRRLRG